MRKIIAGILIIALICITSGAYAVLSENSTVNADNVAVTPNDYKLDSNNLPIEQSLSIIPSNPVKEINAERVIYVGKYAYYLESDGLNDRYIQCVECGGFVPIGDVTNALPDAALCHHYMGQFGLDYKDYSYSHDEAYQIWVNHGQPVFDDGNKIHEEQSDSSLNTPFEGDIIAQYEEVAE